ncbi:MAG: dihydrolipoamide acetyltransferase family protein [Caldilineaceae bacterium]
MATELKLPDLGEGIADVTINRWVKSAGDDVAAGDVVVEVATDKVDTEVVAPVAGKLLKVNFGEGELVDIDAVLALIGAEGEDENDAGPAANTDEQTAKAAPSPTADAEPESAAAEADDADDADGVKATPVAKRVAAEKGVTLDAIAGSGPSGQITKQDVLAFAEKGAPTLISESTALPGELADAPSLIVQRLAADNNIDLDTVAGDKPLSSLTKYDVLSAIASRDAGEEVVVQPRFAAPAGWAQAPSAGQPTPVSAATPAKPSAPASASAAPEASEVLVKPTRMRQIIARNTFESLQSSPQLTTWHDVDMSAVLQHRKAHKKAFEKEGVNLTVTAYLLAATVAGLRAVPAANAAWTDEGILIKRHYNIGMAAAMPIDEYGLGGLVVPVIRNAGELNLLGIARQVNEMAEKARANKLTTTDLQGSTFTLTNYGTSGSVFQTPIIFDGQAGILGTGAVEKRAVVVSNGHPLEANLGDYLTFKPMMTLAFTFDHRVLDGATADAFCVAVKKALENWA